MSQGVCVLDLSLKVYASQPPDFLNVPTKKFDALRRSFGQKLISPNMFRDTQKSV